MGKITHSGVDGEETEVYVAAADHVTKIEPILEGSLGLAWRHQ